MAQEAVSGKSYDHSMKYLVLAVLVVFVVFLVALYALAFWDARHSHALGIGSLGGFVVCMVPLMMGLRPRWRLSPDALVDLRKKTRIPYDSIEEVSVIKCARNGSKTFEIRAAGTAHKVDVLQGEPFENDLKARIAPGLIAQASGTTL